MRGKTLSQITQMAIRELTEVTGTGVQLYTEPSLRQKIRGVFELVWADGWWDQYMRWFTFALDEVTGTHVGDFTDGAQKILSFGDIQFVFADKRREPLVQMPSRTNPNSVTGNRARFIEPVPDATKLFRVLPVESEGNVHIRARWLPEEFMNTTVIDFDDLVLAYGAAYQVLEMDGTNDAAAQMLQGLFETRLKQVKKNELLPQNLSLNIGQHAQIPTEWFVS